MWSFEKEVFMVRVLSHQHKVSQEWVRGTRSLGGSVPDQGDTGLRSRRAGSEGPGSQCFPQQTPPPDKSLWRMYLGRKGKSIERRNAGSLRLGTLGWASPGRVCWNLIGFVQTPLMCVHTQTLKSSLVHGKW